MTALTDPFHLERFVEAQEPIYLQVEAELRRGAKKSHWMWFIFPQLAGLGETFLSRKFSISSLDEARAYLVHPILGKRLQEFTELVCLIDRRSIRQIFGHPDYLKFRSCMTLFALATPMNDVFIRALQKYFDGEPDPLTLQRLGGRQVFPSPN